MVDCVYFVARNDHVNFGPISLIRDVKEPPRTTCTLATTWPIISANKKNRIGDNILEKPD